MKGTRPLQDDSLSAAQSLRMDTICQRFEAAWKQGKTPSLEEFLTNEGGAERASLLRNLLWLELKYRRGQADSAEYESRFPQDRSVVRALFADTNPSDSTLAFDPGASDAPPADASPSTVTRTGVKLSIQESARPQVSPATISLSSASRAAGSDRLPIVPGYEIQCVLGRGGMGVVYKARHLKLNRFVALKMILAGGHAGGEELARFRTEAEAVARLQHPNIVQIHENGEHEGMPYFSLEFCAGGSLEKKLAGTPLPPRAAAALVEKLAQAMQAAHDKGVIHRDLKPAKVLLAENDTPKITDFGLAKKLDEAGQTQTGAIMGTPNYMVPEQAGGKSKELGPPCDIYALGAVLYHCLTGRPPFRAATSLDTLLQVVETEPVAPSQLQTKTPRDLETICLKCLHKEPRKRYATAGELAEDLECFLAGEPIRARPVGRAERSAKWVRRNPLVAAMLALVVVSVLGGASGIFVKYLDAKEQEGIAKQQEGIAKEQEGIAKEQAGIASRKAKDLEAALTDRDAALKQAHDRQAEAEAAERGQREQTLEALMAEARAKRYSGRAGQRFGSIAAVRKATAIARELKKPAAVFNELRNLAVAALALPDFQAAAKTWEGWPAGSSGLDFDPVALRLYARGDERGNISVRRLEDDVEVARLAGAGKPRRVIFGANGETLLLHDANTGELERWKIGAETAEKVATITNGNLQAPWKNIWIWQQSNDGRRFLVAHFTPKGTRAKVLEIPSGRLCFEHELPIRDSGLGLMLALSPDGRSLAWVDGNYGTQRRNQVLLFDIDAGQQVDSLTNPGNVFSPVWHPDCRTLAVGNANTCEVYVWDTLSKRRIHTLRDQKGGNPYLAMSASGQLLTGMSSWTSGQVFWHPHLGKPLLRTPFQFSTRTPVQDGRLYQANIAKTRIILRVAEPSPVYRAFVPNPAGITQAECHDVAIHRDGRLLAVGHSHGVSLFDLPTSLEVGRLELGRNPFARFDSATGDLLTYGIRGLVRWPVLVKPGEPDTITVGPPKQIRQAGGSGNFDVSRDGKVIVVANRTAALVHRQKGSNFNTVSLGPLQDDRFVHISPDGLWVLTVTHDAKIGTIWDARTGRRVAEVPVNPRNRSAHNGYYGLFFTPDNQWLTDGYRRWEVGTWKEGPGRPQGKGPSVLAFTTDGTMFAGQTNDESVHVVDVASGKTLAQLGLPEQNQSRFAAFSPDSTQLVGQSTDNGYVYSWDLRALRRHLAELGLDWDMPPLPQAPRREKRLPPVVTVLLKSVVPGQILVDKKDKLTEEDPGYLPNTNGLAPPLKGFVRLLNSLNRNPHKVYTLKLNKDDNLVIQQMSNEIDSVVLVEDAKNIILALNDDDPDVKGSLNSKLVWTVPADGEYRIIATCMTAVRQNTYGNFRLTVTKTP